MPLGMEVALGPDHIVLDGDPALLHGKGHSSPVLSKFADAGKTAAHVYCGQTAGWIRMPLGTEVCLGPGNIVLVGDLSPPKRYSSPPPHFSAHV